MAIFQESYSLMPVALRLLLYRFIVFFQHPHRFRSDFFTQSFSTYTKIIEASGLIRTAGFDSFHLCRIPQDLLDCHGDFQKHLASNFLPTIAAPLSTHGSPRLCKAQAFERSHEICTIGKEETALQQLQRGSYPLGRSLPGPSPLPTPKRYATTSPVR